MPDDELIRAVLKKDRALARKVRVRDYVELATAVGMAGAFLYVASLVPTPWPWIAAGLVTLGVGGVFVRERRRRPVDGATGQLRDSLERALAEADHQIQLLQSVFWWYLLPLAGVAALIVGGTIWDVRQEMDPAVWARGRGPLLGALATTMLFVGGIFGFVWWLNQYAVKRQLRPHREGIAAIVRQLDANGTGEGA